MLRFLIVVATVHVALAGQVGYPYHLNPAHVTYINGPAPPGLAAGPATYTAQFAAPTAYAAPATFAAPSYAPAVAAPSGYGSFYYGKAAYAPRSYPAYHAYNQNYGYAAVPHAVSAVPTVHHVPGVADVPVTKIEHQPAFIQKVVDVAKPAIQTRKIQVRRPAIQKQFYDIEERVVVRPAGSALVELDEPISKAQKGPTVVSGLAPAVVAHPGFAPVAAYPIAHHPVAVAQPIAPVYPTFPTFTGTPVAPTLVDAPQQEPAYAPEQENNNFAPQQENNNFAPQQDTSNFASPQQPASFAPQQDLESVAIENPEFSGRSAPAPTPAQPEQQQQQQQAQPQEPTPEARAQIENQERAQFEAEQERVRVAYEAEQRAQANQRAQLEAQQNNAQRQQYEQQQREAAQRQFEQQQPAQRQFEQPQAAPRQFEQPQQPAQQRAAPEPAQEQPAAPTPAAETRQAAAPAPEAQAAPSFRSTEEQQQFAAQFLGRQEQQLQTEARFRSNVAEARQVVPSLRSLNPEVNKANQERLIQLLTARGGVAEVQGYGAAAGRTGGAVGDAGTVRARVLSATPAPDHAEPAGERVSTRRIVVSRPIETLQEYDVVEPATKIHRVTVQQPTLIKTARLGVARVPTSVPVYGKTLTAHPIAYY